METEASLAGVGALVLAGLGYLVVQVIGDLAADEAKEALFRRPTLAVRRSRHRVLMKSGSVCAALSFLAALLWLAAATNGWDDDADDARVFATLAGVFALAAGGLLTAWWRRAGTAAA